MTGQGEHEPSLPEQGFALREAELAAARDAAESALAAKNTFLARMGHEIRTPMNAIIGISQLLRRDVAEPRLRRQIDKVLGAASHLLALVDDVLDWSRLEAGEAVVTTTDFAVDQVLGAVTSMISTQAAVKCLDIEIDVAAAVPQVLRGDASRLQQVLLNFATNACKFTARGHMRFTVNVTERTGDRAILRFAVADTGAGLSAEQCNRLFQPFEQADGGVARRFGGTGLGLALCRRLAQLMGGQVGVVSEPGCGSTFWFEAPFEVVADKLPLVRGEPATASRVSTPTGNGRILLVDDNTLNLEVAESLLRLEGLDVDRARDGIEALERAANGAYAAIFMDVQMPRMDVVEATRAIRGLPGHGSTPIIAMTASALDDDRRRCLGAGMSDVVEKPIEPAHLSAVLARWIPAVAGAGLAASLVTDSRADGTGARTTRALLLELQRLVAADDMSARDFCRRLAPSVLGARHAEIVQRLEGFDYDQAADLIAARLLQR